MPENKSFRQIRYDEKKSAMVRTAAKAFGSSTGFHGATIGQIAAELKMTKTSLYYYFSTKEELLYEVHKLSIQEVLDKINEIIGSSDPPDVKLRRTIKDHLKVLGTSYEGSFLLQQEYELIEEHRKHIIALRDEYQSKFVGILREGVKSGKFVIKDPKIASYLILGAINWFLRWYSSSGRLGIDEVSDLCVDVFFNGVLNHQVPAPSSLDVGGDGAPNLPKDVSHSTAKGKGARARRSETAGRRA